MLKNASLAKELVVTVANKIGVLADMSRILADHGINIKAVAGYSDKAQAMIMLVTDDNLRAVEALKEKNYSSIVEKEIILIELENKPGALKAVTAKLAGAGIDINYIYGTACPSGCPASIAISTGANEKALVVFKAK